MLKDNYEPGRTKKYVCSSDPGEKDGIDQNLTPSQKHCTQEDAQATFSSHPNTQPIEREEKLLQAARMWATGAIRAALKPSADLSNPRSGHRPDPSLDGPDRVPA